MMADSESPNDLLLPYQKQIEDLRAAGRQFWNRGWSLGTSSNYSVVIDQNPMRLLVTASGKDKGHLESNDFVLVDESGTPCPEDQPKSSAETALHCSIAKHRNAQAVMHTHSVWATLLSEHFAHQRGVSIEGYEFLKGLSGIDTHQSRIWIPIFENTQDIPSLAAEVEEYWKKAEGESCHAYLIRRHGIYTWGDSIADAVRQIEVLEFLLECLGRSTKLV